MAYKAEVIADSMSPHGHRLTTYETTFPRIVLAEWNTHRVFSRNSASSRAIPVWKQIDQVLEDPFIPVRWGKAQAGMQAESEISPENIDSGTKEWLERRDRAVLGAFALLGGVKAFTTAYEAAKEKGRLVTADGYKNTMDKVIDIRQQLREDGDYLNEEMHKQIPNRILEPWVWHTVITTATEWENFYALRANEEAQPELQKIAHMMQEEFNKSNPRDVGYGEWHLPYVQEEEREEFDELTLRKVAVGRSARVSYLTHDGKKNVEADIALHDKRLYPSGHMSPFEHVARPFSNDEYDLAINIGNIAIEEAESRKLHDDESRDALRLRAKQIAESALFCGNFKGWVQHRKTLPNEDNYAKILESGNS